MRFPSHGWKKRREQFLYVICFLRRKPLCFARKTGKPALGLSEIEQVFKLLFERYCENKRELSSWAELPRFNRAYCLAGYADQFRKIALRQPFFRPRYLQAVF